MASGQLPLVCLLCQQIFNGVFSFSNTGRTLLIRSGISLIIFYLPLERTSKRYLVFEEFSKEFLFLCFTYHVTFFFSFLAAMSEKDILKENSVAVIKRNIHNL